MKIIASEPQTNKNYWILFDQKNSTQPSIMTERAYERRLRRANSTDLSWYDLPVDEQYIRALQNEGASIRVVSRWLNAASVTVDDTILPAMQRLPFVEKIVPIAIYTEPIPELFTENSIPLRKITSLNYGPSLGQIVMLSVDSLHTAGLSGHGILVGMMDTGFNTNHAVFTRMDSLGQIVITHDFINGDSNVIDSPFDGQQGHGTSTLSTLGGFSEGNLIGPAYGAEFVLAKTEILGREIQAEEDYWVAASEWMESLGVDIISSSLGYTDWYDTTDLDGKTALITLAANVANSLGVVVVNSAGNEGNTSWRKVTPPADGFSVIAVGAVDIAGNVVNFSSRGPTIDGRIKPDVCALGSGDYVANANGGYSFESGTSFSAPLVAGSVALLLEGHPGWDLATVINALKNSSSRANNPDNNYGWGIPNMVDAFYGEPFEAPSRLFLGIWPHPAIDSVVFHIFTPIHSSFSLSVHDINGAKIFERDIDSFEAKTDTIVEVWNGHNGSNDKVASGIYIAILKTGNSYIRQKFFFLAQ